MSTLSTEVDLNSDNVFSEIKQQQDSQLLQQEIKLPLPLQQQRIRRAIDFVRSATPETASTSTSPLVLPGHALRADHAPRARPPYRRTSTPPQRPVLRHSVSAQPCHYGSDSPADFVPLRRLPLLFPAESRAKLTDTPTTKRHAADSNVSTDSNASLVDSGHGGVSDTAADVFSLTPSPRQSASSPLYPVFDEISKVDLPPSYVENSATRAEKRRVTLTGITSCEGLRSNEVRKCELGIALDWISQEVQCIRTTERSLVRVFGELRNTLHQLTSRMNIFPSASGPQPLTPNTPFLRQRTTSACSYCGDADRLQCWSPPPDIGVELRMPLAIDNFRPRAISMLTAGEDRRIYIERQKAQ